MSQGKGGDRWVMGGESAIKGDPRAKGGRRVKGGPAAIAERRERPA